MIGEWGSGQEHIVYALPCFSLRCFYLSLRSFFIPYVFKISLFERDERSFNVTTTYSNLCNIFCGLVTYQYRYCLTVYTNMTLLGLGVFSLLYCFFWWKSSNLGKTKASLATRWSSCSSRSIISLWVAVNCQVPPLAIWKCRRWIWDGKR